MRSIFQMDKVHNIFCINGIAAHIFDGWRWVGGGRRIAFPSICPYGFHTRGGSRPYRVAETPAEAFLTTAQQYHLAATTLLPIHQRAEAPLYFLFTHAIELALKAYLRAHGLSTPRGPQGHALHALFAQCQSKGLQGGSDLRNVLQLLASENKLHGFRYVAFEGTGRPDIHYLREVVDELMGVIEEEVNNRPTQGLTGAVLKFTVGKPEKIRIS